LDAATRRTKAGRQWSQPRPITSALPVQVRLPHPKKFEILEIKEKGTMNPNIGKLAAKGAAARNKILTKKRRYEIAMKAITTRWARAKLKKELDIGNKGK